MTERVADPSIDRIREHVRGQVARTSLRKVAKRAGVKVGATKKFIDGSVPYERNLRLWKKYYARELRAGVAGQPDDALPGRDARAVLELLLWGFPEDERLRAAREAVDLFHGLYQSHRHTPPRWVLVLRGEAADAPDPDAVPEGDADGDDEGDEE
ncbi:MAG TPA: hypothetical protein VEY93_16230 [Longimicrobium sp.]|nr:hypothetical protein [Longimicrobium sp.]